MSDTTFFIKIDDPKEFRKSLLYSVRDMLQTLQRYEHIQNLRVEKAKMILHLKRISKEIQGLIKDLENALPDVHYEKKDGRKKAGHKKKSRSRVAVPAPVHNQLDALESELRKIDEKIKVIS